MGNRNNRVCPVTLAGFLDNGIRRWVQNPRKILAPYVREGMTVLDVGCGPGFFSIEMARMVGRSGRVIAADLQEGMLRKVKDKIQGTELEGRITLHQCEKERLGVTGPVDFVLAFYMLHELPDQQGFLREVKSLLKPGGSVLIVEPSFHVSKTDFEVSIGTARDTGLKEAGRPKLFFNRAVILQHA